MTPISPIHDGYTVKAVIPPKGPWHGVTFHYRPLIGPAHAEFIDQGKRGHARFKAICKLLSDQLVSWDVQKPGAVNENDTVPITEDNLARMPMAYLDEMTNAVLGYSALDQEAAV